MLHISFVGLMSAIGRIEVVKGGCVGHLVLSEVDWLQE